MTTRRVHVHLLPSQIEKLDALATITTMPRSMHVRLAVAQYLKRASQSEFVDTLHSQIRDLLEGERGDSAD